MEDILCIQRNGPFQFFEVTLSTDKSYSKVLERSKERAQYPLLGRYTIEPLWWSDKRVITVHCFNQHVTTKAVRQFLNKYVDLLPGHKDIRDELGIWTGRHQFQARLCPDANGAGGFSHPPAYFNLQGNKAYLFYSGQPPFCRQCHSFGHTLEGCANLRCRNCPCRSIHCNGEDHLARSCPQRKISYADALSGSRAVGTESGGGGQAPTVGSVYVGGGGGVAKDLSSLLR
uniref:Zinc finger CCHC domain-containing protein n=1 Tax=Paramormyrops kingsleyae TaxID=1676925 RepID=A0A3B3RA04_9TELE